MLGVVEPGGDHGHSKQILFFRHGISRRKTKDKGQPVSGTASYLLLQGFWVRFFFHGLHGA